MQGLQQGLLTSTDKLLALFKNNVRNNNAAIFELHYKLSTFPGLQMFPWAAVPRDMKKF
jgi:hypothetical protein